MGLKKDLIRQMSLSHVEETKWNDIWESRTHIFIFNKIDDDMKVKRKRASRRAIVPGRED